MKLLLIEDNPDDVAVVERLASMSPVPIDVAAISDGPLALAWLRDHETPDVILLDLGLPGLSGSALLGRIKEREGLGDVPVIVVSGSERDEDVLEGLRLGAHSHVVKPICGGDFAWIVASVRRAGPRLEAVRCAVERGRGQ